MATLGEELKRRREARSITLSEISEATRIGTRFLKAIETDNFSALPGGLFTRSFIRAYARKVGMDEEEAVAAYQQQVSEQPDQLAEAEANKPTRARVFVPWNRLGIIAAALVVTIGVVLLAIRLAGGGGSAERQTGPSPAPLTERRLEEPSPPTQLAAVSPGPETPAGDSSLELSVAATDGDCWLRYQVDDTNATSVMLKAGQARNLPPAKSQIVLTIGNRRNLVLKINNQRVSFPPDVPSFAAQVKINQQNLTEFLKN